MRVMAPPPADAAFSPRPSPPPWCAGPVRLSFAATSDRQLCWFVACISDLWRVLLVAVADRQLGIALADPGDIKRQFGVGLAWTRGDDPPPLLPRGPWGETVA